MRPGVCSIDGDRELTDDQLVALVRRGDERAFTLLVERHRERLVRYAASRLGCSEAEDVVQEAMLRAYGALRSGANPESPIAWLHAIVRNGAFDAQRRQVRQRAAPLHDELPETLDGPDALVEQRMRVDATLEGMRGLPERQREALAQVALGGLSYDEVAASQETSVTAVKALVNRARVNLRRAAAGVAATLPGLRQLGGLGTGALAKIPVLLALIAGAAAVPGFSVTVPAVAVPPAVADQLGQVRHERTTRVETETSAVLGTAARATRAPSRAAASTEHVLRACSGRSSLDRYDAASLLRAQAAMPTDVAEYTDCGARLERALHG